MLSIFIGPWNSHRPSCSGATSPDIMMTSSNGNIFRVTGPRNWPFNKGQWRGALMFSLISAWINAWVKNREVGNLRRQRAHCDVIMMGKYLQKCTGISCVIRIKQCIKIAVTFHEMYCIWLHLFDIVTSPRMDGDAPCAKDYFDSTVVTV